MTRSSDTLLHLRKKRIPAFAATVLSATALSRGPLRLSVK
jgi:hypothetical protein